MVNCIGIRDAGALLLGTSRYWLISLPLVLAHFALRIVACPTELAAHVFTQCIASRILYYQAKPEYKRQLNVFWSSHQHNAARVSDRLAAGAKSSRSHPSARVHSLPDPIASPLFLPPGLRGRSTDPRCVIKSQDAPRIGTGGTRSSTKSLFSDF